MTIADSNDGLGGMRDASIDNSGRVTFFGATLAGTTLPSGGNAAIFVSDGTSLNILFDNSDALQQNQFGFRGNISINDMGLVLFPFVSLNPSVRASS